MNRLFQSLLKRVKNHVQSFENGVLGGLAEAPQKGLLYESPYDNPDQVCKAISSILKDQNHIVLIIDPFYLINQNHSRYFYYLFYPHYLEEGVLLSKELLESRSIAYLFWIDYLHTPTKGEQNLKPFLNDPRQIKEQFQHTHYRLAKLAYATKTPMVLFYEKESPRELIQTLSGYTKKLV